jgi:hypothetical protein
LLLNVERRQDLEGELALGLHIPEAMLQAAVDPMQPDRPFAGR